MKNFFTSNLWRLYLPALFLIGLGAIFAYNEQAGRFSLNLGTIIVILGIVMFFLSWLGERQRIQEKEQYILERARQMPSYPEILDFLSGKKHRIPEWLIATSGVFIVVSVFMVVQPAASILEAFGGVGLVMAVGLFAYRKFFFSI